MDPVKGRPLVILKQEIPFVNDSFDNHTKGTLKNNNFLKDLFEFSNNDKDNINEETIELLEDCELIKLNIYIIHILEIFRLYLNIGLRSSNACVQTRSAPSVNPVPDPPSQKKRIRPRGLPEGLLADLSGVLLNPDHRAPLARVQHLYQHT